jgi:hypothetical protein
MISGGLSADTARALSREPSRCPALFHSGHGSRPWIHRGVSQGDGAALVADGSDVTAGEGDAVGVTVGPGVLVPGTGLVSGIELAGVICAAGIGVAGAADRAGADAAAGAGCGLTNNQAASAIRKIAVTIQVVVRTRRISRSRRARWFPGRPGG